MGIASRIAAATEKLSGDYPTGGIQYNLGKLEDAAESGGGGSFGALTQLPMAVNSIPVVNGTLDYSRTEAIKMLSGNTVIAESMWNESEGYYNSFNGLDMVAAGTSFVMYVESSEYSNANVYLVTLDSNYEKVTEVELLQHVNAVSDKNGVTFTIPVPECSENQMVVFFMDDGR